MSTSLFWNQPCPANTQNDTPPEPFYLLIALFNHRPLRTGCSLSLSLNCSKEKVFGHSLLQATGGRSTKAWTLRGSAVALGRHHANAHGYLQTIRSIPLFTNRPTLLTQVTLLLQTTIYHSLFCLVQPAKQRANGLAAQARRGILNDICPPGRPAYPPLLSSKDLSSGVFAGQLLASYHHEQRRSR